MRIMNLLNEVFSLRNERLKKAKLSFKKLVSLKKDVFLAYFEVFFPVSTHNENEKVEYEFDPEILSDFAKNLSEYIGADVKTFNRSADYEKNHIILAIKGNLERESFQKINKMRPLSILVKEIRIKNVDYYQHKKEKNKNDAKRGSAKGKRKK